MSALLTPAAPLRTPGVGADEAAARRALRQQIARLEAEAAQLDAWTGPAGAPARPRLLSLAELEATRDALVERLHAGRVARDELGRRQEGFRRLREEMLLDPAAHPYVRVTNADVGEPGCHDWHVRPRFGLLGVLMRWWRVVVSSGCP
ncbi:MAG TPA: hypothetical protein VF712_05695 [Thermoleophilaceae bacterium]|jgi:hypothetical protein